MTHPSNLMTVDHACEVVSRDYELDPPITVKDVLSHRIVDDDVLVIEVDILVPTTHKHYKRSGDRWTRFGYHYGPKNRENLIRSLEKC